MSIEFHGEVIVAGFQQQADGQESPWSLRIRKQDKFAILRLHWADKESATHVAFANLEAFKQMVASL